MEKADIVAQLRIQLEFAEKTLRSLIRLLDRAGPLRNPWKDSYSTEADRQIDFTRHVINNIYHSVASSNPRIQRIDHQLKGT